MRNTLIYCGVEFPPGPVAATNGCCCGACCCARKQASRQTKDAAARKAPLLGLVGFRMRHSELLHVIIKVLGADSAPSLQPFPGVFSDPA